MGSVCSRNPIVLNHYPSQINEYSRNSDIRKKYEFVSILGSGSFGKVRLYRDRKCKGMKYAIKTLVKDGVTRNVLDCLISEVAILRSLDHPNIVKYYETFEDDYYVHIVMDYLQGDDLYKVLVQQAKELKEKKINYTEFLAATMSSLNFSKEEEIWSAFKYFEETEADKEGTISIESLFKALRAFNISVDEEAIRKGFNELENKGKVLDFDVFKELVSCANNQTEN